MRAYSWSADDLAHLRELAAEGLPTSVIADRIGRTMCATWSIMNRHGMTIARERVAVREHVLGLARAGWTVSRISKQHGFQEVAVRRLLAMEGVEPGSVGPRPTGRLAQGEAA